MQPYSTLSGTILCILLAVTLPASSFARPTTGGQVAGLDIAVGSNRLTGHGRRFSLADRPLRRRLIPRASGPHKPTKPRPPHVRSKKTSLEHGGDSHITTSPATPAEKIKENIKDNGMPSIAQMIASGWKNESEESKERWGKIEAQRERMYRDGPRAGTHPSGKLR